MAVTFTDDEIAALIETPKESVGGPGAILAPREKRGHLETQAMFTDSAGNQFKVILRRSVDTPLDFSAILAVQVPESNRWFRLRRYNGKSHRHKNHIEGDAFYAFHYHTATERYQRSGRREDAYAEPTDRYGDYESAVRCMEEDACVALGHMRASPQLFFPLEGGAWRWRG